MNLKKLIEQIDEDYYKSNSHYLSITNPEELAEQVALKFGKQCFEAGKKMETMQVLNTVKNFIYETFKDYLKSLEDENM